LSDQVLPFPPPPLILRKTIEVCLFIYLFILNFRKGKKKKRYWKKD
jgi:hypothetical protein